MRFAWANTLLLVCILSELVTCFFALTAGGTTNNAVFITVHRVAGYGILFIRVRKLPLTILSLRHPNSRTPRYASLFLLLALLMTLGSSLAWSVVGEYHLTGFIGVSWHINAGALLIPVFAWHTIYQTRGFLLSSWSDRRWFLRLEGVATAGLAA